MWRAKIQPAVERQLTVEKFQQESLLGKMCGISMVSQVLNSFGWGFSLSRPIGPWPYDWRIEKPIRWTKKFPENKLPLSFEIDLQWFLFG